MRFGITTAFSAARRAHEEAYATYDRLADAGDEGVKQGGTPAADDASAAEYAALDALLLMPAVTTVEVKEKLALMESRGVDTCWGQFPKIIEQMQLDLINMARPNVSPAVDHLFAQWATAFRTAVETIGVSDAEHDRLCGFQCEAYKQLLAVPCTAPGDLIAKLYVELISEYGPTYRRPGVGNVFEIDVHGFDEVEGLPEAHLAFIRDITDSDLGCCMIALGRTDFDAAAWVAACRQHGKQVHLSMRGEERAGLTFGMLGPHTPMLDILQRLTANGLAEVSTLRCKAIADEIEANHPDLIWRVDEQVAEAAE